MLYKFGPMGYFGRTSQISRGPWFAELQVEDDGLEQYYMHNDAAGNMRYLLSNNMSYKDRCEMQALFAAQSRVNSIGWFSGMFSTTHFLFQIDPPLSAPNKMTSTTNLLGDKDLKEVPHIVLLCSL